MADYKYFKSIIQYRIPILENGTLGNPEITSKFTTEDYAPKKKKPVKKEKKTISTTSSSGEVWI